MMSAYSNLTGAAFLLKSFLTALLMALAAPVQAQQDIRQSNLELYTQSIDGKIGVCGVQYTFVFKDDINPSALPGGVTGSISHAIIDGDFVTMLKVIAVSGLTIIPVHLASIKAKNEILKPSQLKCIDGRNFCGKFFNDDSTKIINALSSDGLEIRYNIESGGLDYAFPISITKVKNPEKFNEYTDCLANLFATSSRH